MPIVVKTAPHAAALLAYAVLAVAYTWPMAWRLDAAAPNDLGDPLLSTWILWWNATATPLTERWWNGAFFFPAPDALALSEHRLGIAVISTPAIWLGVSPLAAHNIAFLTSFPLSAFGAYGLGFALTRSYGAAFLAGLVFGFNPFRAGHLPHLELLCSYFLPVALLALHRWWATRKVGWLIALSAALTMQALISTYYLAFVGILIGLWIIWFVRMSVPPRQLAALLASLLAPLVLVAPILLRYRQAHASMGLARTMTDIESFSADLVGLITAPQTLALWNTPLSWDRGEGALYPGFVTLAIAIAGLVVSRNAPAARLLPWARWARGAVLAAAAVAATAATIPAIHGPVSTDLLGLHISVSGAFKPTSASVMLLTVWLLTTARVRRAWHSRDPLAFYALATVAMWAFALGPTGRVLGHRFLYMGPYAWLMQLPGIDTAFRVPARFGMLAALTLSAAAALAWVRLVDRRSRRTALIATVVAATAIAADSWIRPLATPPAPQSFESVSQAPPDAVILELPLGTFEDAAAMYRAIHHGRPIANGLSGFAPPSYQVLHAALAEARVEVLEGLAAMAPILVFLDRAAAGMELTSRLRAWPSASLLREHATHDVILIPRRSARLAAELRGTAAAVQAGTASLEEEALPLIGDGVRHTGWMTPTQEGVETIVLDLGRVEEVTGITMDLGAWPGGFPRTLSLQTSVDGARWDSAWLGDVAGLAFEAAVADQRNVRLPLPCDPRPARYVRVQQLGQSPLAWAIAELRVLINRQR